MATKTCQICGAEFTPKPRHPNQKYCSARCARTAYKRKNRKRSRDTTRAEREARHAKAISEPVSNDTIMRASRKPANTSAVRWRIELRRRASPERYEMLGRA